MGIVIEEPTMVALVCDTESLFKSALDKVQQSD
jgi:hypothetical protein